MCYCNSLYNTILRIFLNAKQHLVFIQEELDDLEDWHNIKTKQNLTSARSSTCGILPLYAARPWKISPGCRGQWRPWGLFSYVTSHCCPAAEAFFILFICSMCRLVTLLCVDVLILECSCFKIQIYQLKNAKRKQAYNQLISVIQILKRGLLFIM